MIGIDDTGIGFVILHGSWILASIENSADAQ
jgi:hypothetical protein